MIKKQLLELEASVNLQFLSCIVDYAAARPGSIAFRFPPYHCKFNPIELVWVKVKNGVVAEKKGFKLSTVVAILRKKIKHATAEDWRKKIRHVSRTSRQSSHLTHLRVSTFNPSSSTEETDYELSGIEAFNEA